MAEILEVLFRGEVSPCMIVNWMKGQQNDVSIPNGLLELENIKQEFIPYFLNYLRDHTIHLIQSSKSATPSPAKTPSLKKYQKSGGRGHGRESSKRQQLFGASPAADSEEIDSLPSSVFSPNISLDSPRLVNQKGDRGQGKRRSGYSSQKASPQCGSQRSPYTHQTPEQQRSKQKLSLGEFIVTPDHTAGSQNWKKKSPHSGGRRDVNFDSSPSGSHSRRSSGRRKQSNSPLLLNYNCNNDSRQSPTPPVFCLSSANEFPPVGTEEIDKNGNNLYFSDVKTNLSSRSRATQDYIKKTPVSNNKPKFATACDIKISREINFCKSESERLASVSFACNRFQDVKKSTSTQEGKEKMACGPRRITPTIIKEDQSVTQNSAFMVPIQEIDICDKNSSVFIQSAIVDDKPSTLEEERELLKQEKERWKSLTQTTDNFTRMTPKKPSFEHSTSVIETIEAVLSDVTHSDKLDLLSALYSRCLSENLFPNVIVELYFLVQLLTAQGGSGNEEEEESLLKQDLTEENFFTSVHNTVYFAVCVLEDQKKLLSKLDRGTIRLLIENPRIAAFSVDLKIALESLYDMADVMKGPAFPRSPIGSVSFQADTDNRKNFPNDKAFHMFKRQRDGFYELLREWEASRMNPNYNMGDKFGARVRALVGMGGDLVNFIHFSRLFQSQLIAMCKGDGSIRTSEDDENIALLSQLKRTNPEKFKRLQERFIKPFSFGGPCPTPSFPGCQEFFKDFIVLAGSPLLNQHLCDTFTSKIQELDETTFSTPDDDDHTAGNEDEEEKDVFRTVLLNLRLIGKFLGFVTFLPYQTTERIPESIESTYISMRNKIQPPVDLMLFLRSAILTGKVTLTVPWVVEFLSMMDKLAPRLDYFQTALLYLLCIHRYVWSKFQDEYSYSTLLLVGLISWLFENPVMPDGFFFSEIPEDFVDLEDLASDLCALDNRDYVDQSLFYTCCPYIGEMKALLMEFAVGTSSKTSTIRKITPVSADTPVQKSLSETQLQLQMEENFFHNHPASMKRVVDFVADRTASNFIKKFRSHLLQESITEGKDKVLKQILTVTEGSPTNKLKDKVTMTTKKVAQEVHSHVRTRVTDDAPNYCHERTPTIMRLLLPDDQSSVVVSVASDISRRIAMEKITHWMTKNITIAMYQTELTPESDKISKAMHSKSQAQCSTADTKEDINTTVQEEEYKKITSDEHDDTLPHPSEVLIDLKDMVKNCTLRSDRLTSEMVLSKLKLISQVLDKRQDILPSVNKSFSHLIVEVLLVILISHDDLYTEEIINSCISLWRTCQTDTRIQHIFSGRVVYMLHGENQKTWDRYTDLLLKLYKQNLLHPSDVQEACMRFLPSCKDESVLTKLARCLRMFTMAVPECEIGEEIGSCLELLYDLLPDPECNERKQILCALGVHTDDNNVTDRKLHSS